MAARPRTLLTFGVPPTHPATGYGYLELGEPITGEGPRRDALPREAGPASTAEGFLAAGPDRYLWNSGLFLWKASTFLDCVRRYEPETFRGIERIRAAWGTRRRRQRARAPCTRP